MQVLRVSGKERQIDGAVVFKYAEAPHYVPTLLVQGRHPGGAALKEPGSGTTSSFAVGEILIYRGLSRYGYRATVTHCDMDHGMATVAVWSPFNHADDSIVA